ncbi:MAG: tetratricopeptide repeat protein [Actinomycetota bacterium]|nr:tetratricopeptide repeat protein [Actinomycetota bacterium]
MDFRVLGSLEALQGSQPVHLGDRQQRYVLAALLLEANKPVPMDRLVEIIWGPAGHTSATTLINGYISRLRTIFKKAGADGIRLDSDSGSTRTLRVDVARIDYFRFVDLRNQAKVAQCSGDDAQAMALLHEAVALWRDDFLADLDNDELRRPYRQTLQRIRLKALHDLAQLEFDNGNHGWVIDLLYTPVSEDPSNERLAGLLGRAMLETEDRTGALAIVKSTTRALLDSGMTPSPELRKIQQRALRGEPEHAPAQLPRDHHHFTGREVELDVLLTGWRTTADQPVASSIMKISGMPGVGKTALAVHAAHRLAHHFPDGQLIINLHGFTPNLGPVAPSAALERLLKLLGVPGAAIPEGLEDRAAFFRSTLVGTRRLILLDNAKDEAQVEPLLPGTAGSLVIVTSRRRLSGLDYTRGVHLDPMPAGDAVTLLRRIVSPHRIDWQDGAAEDVIELSGRLPLAIRLLAGRLMEHPNWQLKHLAALLRKRAQRLVEFDPAERRLVATFYVSYEQLMPEQQRVFRLLGAVPGPDFDDLDVAALADTAAPDVGEALEVLHRVSLIEDVSPGRYRLHDLLRTYAEMLDGDDPTDRDAAVARLLGYYLHTATSATSAAFPHDRHRLPPAPQQNSPDPEFGTDQDGLNWLRSEHGNLVAAIRHSAHRGWHEFTWKLACVIWRYLYTRGYLDEWADTLRLALAAARESENVWGQAQALQHLSIACWRSGDSQQALELGRQALQLWQQLGDHHGEADAYSVFGLAAKRLGRFTEARDHYGRAMDLYAELDDRRGYANVMDNLGDIDERVGLLQPALERHNTALSILQNVHDRHGQLYVLNNIGSVRQQLGQLDDAVRLHRRALAISEEIEYPHGTAFSLNYLGAAYQKMGHLETAKEFHERALVIAEDLGDPTLGTDVNNDFGETCRARGEHTEAMEHHRLALLFANRTGDIRERARAHHGIARAMHAAELHQDAKTHWLQAVVLYRDLTIPESDHVTTELSGLDCECQST